MSILRPALDAYAATHNKFDPEDRAHTVGASDVGQCERKTFYVKNAADLAGYGSAADQDYEDGWGAKMRGTIFEDALWYPALKAQYGSRLLYAGPSQQTFVSGFLSATPDGLLIDLTPEERAAIAPDCGTAVMVECKTADPRTNLTEPKPANVYQTQVQMGLMRELRPGTAPTHSILSYTNASFWDQGPEFIIPFDPKVYAVAKSRAARIMTAQSARDLKPEGYIAGGKDCQYCPFTKACGIERRRVPDKELLGQLDPQFVAEITDLARAIKVLKKNGEDNDAKLRDAEQELKDRLRDKSVKKVPGVVTWSSVKGRAGWDNKAIREELEARGAIMDDYRTEGEAGDRLMITLP